MRRANFDELLRPCLSSIFAPAPPPDRGLPFHEPAALPSTLSLVQLSIRSFFEIRVGFDISLYFQQSLSRRWIIFLLKIFYRFIRGARTFFWKKSIYMHFYNSVYKVFLNIINILQLLFIL